MEIKKFITAFYGRTSKDDPRRVTIEIQQQTLRTGPLATLWLAKSSTKYGMMVSLGSCHSGSVLVARD